MNKLDSLLLLSGDDIPLTRINLVLHQPTLKEIGYIGEDAFFRGCEFLKLSKNKINIEDKSSLENISNFEIIMSIMREKNNPVAAQNAVTATMVLSLLFPTYEIQINTKKMEIEFKQNENIFVMNKDNYDEFVEVLGQILSLDGSEEADYNPSGRLARQIANKLRDRQAKLAAAKNDNQKITILSRYVSTLAVGENKDMNSLLNYTLYQLFDEFTRYQLKVAWDIHLQAQMAGAKNLKDVDDWMKDIHSDVDMIK